jgi:hypothetical protein
VHIETIPAWLAGTNAYLVVSDSGLGLLVDAPPDHDLIGAHVARLDVPMAMSTTPVERGSWRQAPGL